MDTDAQPAEYWMCVQVGVYISDGGNHSDDTETRNDKETRIQIHKGFNKEGKCNTTGEKHEPHEKQ